MDLAHVFYEAFIVYMNLVCVQIATAVIKCVYVRLRCVYMPKEADSLRLQQILLCCSCFVQRDHKERESGRKERERGRKGGAGKGADAPPCVPSVSASAEAAPVPFVLFARHRTGCSHRAAPPPPPPPPSTPRPCVSPSRLGLGSLRDFAFDSHPRLDFFFSPVRPLPPSARNIT